uniref:Uncharacterized protein n=1 Tax=Anopheles atroparvus TaxID=41427 RepID=A0AAG5DSS3_ANOAO
MSIASNMPPLYHFSKRTSFGSIVRKYGRESLSPIEICLDHKTCRRLKRCIFTFYWPKGMFIKINFFQKNNLIAHRTTQN